MWDEAEWPHTQYRLDHIARGPPETRLLPEGSEVVSDAGACLSTGLTQTAVCLRDLTTVGVCSLAENMNGDTVM